MIIVVYGFSKRNQIGAFCRKFRVVKELCVGNFLEFAGHPKPQVIVETSCREET